MTGTAVASSAHAAVGVTATSTATCTAGKVLVAGGARVTFTGAERGSVLESYPSTAGANGVWTASGIAIVAGSGGDTFTVTAYAYCA